jgi:hypothetical protein
MSEEAVFAICLTIAVSTAMVVTHSAWPMLRFLVLLL